MNRTIICCLLALLCGCRQQAATPKTPAASAPPQQDIPADSFLLSIEDQPATGSTGPTKPSSPTKPTSPTKPSTPFSSSESEIRRTVSILSRHSMEPMAEIQGGFFNPLWLTAGVGGGGPSSPIPPNAESKATITFVVTPVHKDGTEERFYRFRTDVEAASMGEEKEYPLAKGEKLTDVLEINVQPGLYKIGSPVRLGNVRLGSTNELTLRVEWRAESHDKQPKKRRD